MKPRQLAVMRAVERMTTVSQPDKTVQSEHDSSHASSIVVSDKDARKMARAAFVGTALEWYDYYLFGTAASLVFNRLFFSDFDPTAALLASFATFGVGFLARPLGAMFFGWMGDKYGRRPALLITIIGIGVTTGLIGVLPDYSTAGLWAPALLVILRLLQGLAVGGEWGGAVTMAIEHAPESKRGRYAALVQIGSPVATLLSSAAFSAVLLLDPEAFDAWGWRLPFLLAIPLLGVALWIRVSIEESPVFLALEKEEQAAKTPAFEVFTKAGSRLVVAVLAALLGVAGFYMITTFAISYGTNTLGLDKQLMVNATLIGAVFQIITTIIMGRLAERLGAGRVTVIGGVVAAVAALPIFWLIDTKEPVLVILAIVIGFITVATVYAVNGTLLAELFPAKFRYSGVALGYNIAGALAGFMPMIATAMLNVSNDQSWGAAIILMLLSLLTALGGFLGQRMRLSDNVVEA